MSTVLNENTTHHLSGDNTFPFILTSDMHQLTFGLCPKMLKNHCLLWRPKNIKISLETVAGLEVQVTERIEMLNPCLLCGLVLHPLLASPLPSLDAHPLCLRFLRWKLCSPQYFLPSPSYIKPCFLSSDYSFLTGHFSSYFFRSRRAVHSYIGLQVGICPRPSRPS